MPSLRFRYPQILARRRVAQFDTGHSVRAIAQPERTRVASCARRSATSACGSIGARSSSLLPRRTMRVSRSKSTPSPASTAPRRYTFRAVRQSRQQAVFARQTCEHGADFGDGRDNRQMLRPFGRCRFCSHGSSAFSTARYRNSAADSAWLCVDAATRRRLASIVRYTSTSNGPTSRGWRRPYKRMKSRARSTHAPSVRKLMYRARISHRRAPSGVGGAEGLGVSTDQLRSGHVCAYRTGATTQRHWPFPVTFG